MMRGMIAAPTRRILNMKEAASYMGMSVTTFREQVAPQVKGVRVLPKRISYDVEELNSFIDRMSGKSTDSHEQNFWDKFR
ncbi:hypothetical protein QQM41_09970 [Acetobacter sp. AC2005]